MHQAPTATAVTTLPILYSFRRCPYAIRARLAIAQAGIEVQVCEVALRDKPQALLSLSPKGTVPVLQLPQGGVIEESLDIMRWALRLNDPQGWLRGGAHDALIDLNDHPFKHWLDRYKYAQRHPEHSASHYRNEAVRALVAVVEERLADQMFLGGDTPNLADAALFPFVRQFAAVDTVWFDTCLWWRTREWLAAWAQSEIFIQVMAKTPGAGMMGGCPARHQAPD